MAKRPHFISICSQKGGVGKSTFTVLAASLLHYRMGRRVLVVDCDYPQWSIHEQRQRELQLIDGSDRYKLMLLRQYKTTGRKIWPVVLLMLLRQYKTTGRKIWPVVLLMLLRQFKTTGRKIWPVVHCRLPEALGEAERFLDGQDEEYDYVLFDLPGATAVKGVLPLVSSLERVFIPMKADKMVMESSVVFARLVAESFVPNPECATAGVHMFWTMIDRRERTPLYGQYEAALARFNLPVMRTHVPARSRFGRELQPGGGPVSRSTLFPPERAFAAECCLQELCEEICTLCETR